MTGPRVRRQHDVLRRIGRESARADRLSRVRMDHAAGMRDASRGADEDRHIKSLGQLERERRERAGLLAVAWLQQRDAGETSEEPVVLLVLRAVHSRVVGGDDHEAGAGARIRGRHEGVGGDVQADVLHRRERARAADGRPERDVERDLLVACPFDVDGALDVGTHERLKDLGAWRARVADSDGDPGLPGATSDRLVAGEEHALARRDRSFPRSRPGVRHRHT